MPVLPHVPPTALLETATRLIAEDRLPAQSGRVWSGRGSGKLCDLCGTRIHFRQNEVELDTAEGVPSVRFHRECHAIWERACCGG
jgi:hypothetical protein